MKNVMRRFTVLALTAALAASVAGCGAKTPEDASAQEPQAQSTEAETAEVGETQSAETAQGPDFSEEVTLRYVIPAVADSYPGWDAVLEELNRVTKEKINANIEVELIPIGEYTDKMNMKFTAGEEFDLCFTGAWNPYLPAVTKGAYAELTPEVLNTYAPELMEELNSAVWDALRVSGRIYGVPIQQIYVRQTGIRVPTELAAKYNFDVSKVKELDDLDDYLADVKANEPDVVPVYLSNASAMDIFVSAMGFDCLVSPATPGAVYFAADKPEVINQFESPEFRELCDYLRKWQQAGYLPVDAVTGADSVGEAVRAVAFDPAHKPGGDVVESGIRGYQIDGAPFGDCAMTTSAVQATITAVSATSENVERAVACANLLNTDPEVLNLICHGIEGVDYEFVGDRANGLIKPISDYPGMLSFLIGNVFNEYYTDELQIGTWEETAEINNSAKSSCLLGFVFDSDSVSTEIAQCSAVTEEYLPGLMCGALDVDSGLAEFQKELRTAGVDVILEEMQSQVEAWEASR